MAGDGKNRWVVLLNRSPKGPLTEDEVKTLLAQGILRQNDIAFLVTPEGGDKTKSEWKLLWQFPEFNRRQTEPAPAKADAPRPAAEERPEERRRRIPPEEIQKRAMEDLPPDLMEIAPEDLLPRSTQIQFKPEPDNISPVPEVALSADKPERSSRGFDLRWVYGAGAIGLIAFAAIRLPALLKHERRAPRIDQRDPATGNIDALMPADRAAAARSAPAQPATSRPASPRRVHSARPQVAPPTAAPVSDRPPVEEARDDRDLDRERELERERDRERELEREQEREEERYADEAPDEGAAETGSRKKFFKNRKPTTEEESAGYDEGASAPAAEVESERGMDSPSGDPDSEGAASNLDQPAYEDDGGR